VRSQGGENNACRGFRAGHQIRSDQRDDRGWHNKRGARWPLCSVSPRCLPRWVVTAEPLYRGPHQIDKDATKFLIVIEGTALRFARPWIIQRGSPAGSVLSAKAANGIIGRLIDTLGGSTRRARSHVAAARAAARTWQRRLLPHPLAEHPGIAVQEHVGHKFPGSTCDCSFTICFAWGWGRQQQRHTKFRAGEERTPSS
jgi:hypothetical protein